MSEILFIKPKITGKHSAPVALENKGFPYNELADHRRYEELVYSIFQEKIRSKDFLAFDEISLMSGVRDKGRDCTLYTRSSFTGLIQCKKYASPLGKNRFGEELIKFLLYTLVYEEVKFDINRFTYYIAASSGFADSCSDFIDKIKVEIRNDQAVIQWIQKHLKNELFSEIKIDNALSYVILVLENINVKKINPQDLDRYLSQRECKELIPLFFQVRSVVDNEEVKNLAVQLEEMVGSQLNEEQIRHQLSLGSNSLKLEKNEFDEIPNSHIPREETQRLLKWIHEPLEVNSENKPLNICILAGDAGMGKTVILKDLYEALSQDSIPVLGLKTDKIYVSSINEFQHMVGLSIPIIDFLNKCEEKFTKTVLILDQLDALSQSMSSERNYLMVFKSLIDYFTHRPKIRLVLSIRLKDLFYDPTLKSYRAIEHIKVGLLSEDQVLSQLKKLDITHERLPAKLIYLLRVPHHLNIFSRIAKGKSNFTGLLSIHDLYSELWKQQVILKPENLGLKSKRIRKLLYKIVQYFFENQRTEVHLNRFEKFSRELSYLESEHLIKREKDQLQLFHQTFYDFIFAKKFVEDQKDLLSYILEQEQSLLIRSAVKMIVSYLREFDPHKYYATNKILLKDSRVLFHIKHMLISLLAFQEEPTKEESALLLDCLKHSIALKILFFELARSDSWFKVIVEEDKFKFLNDPPQDSVPENEGKEERNTRYLWNTGINFLSYYVNKNNIDAWSFVENETVPEVKKEILLRREDWSHPKTYALYKDCPPLEFTSFHYQTIMANLVKFKPAFVWEELKDYFLSNSYLQKAYPHDYTLINTLQVLVKKIPEVLIPDLMEKVIYDLDNPEKESEQMDFSSSNPYEGVDLETEEDPGGKDVVYQILAKGLRSAAEAGSPVYLKFLKQYNCSEYFPVLRLIVFSLQGNERQYFDSVFHLLQLFNKLGLLGFYDKPGREFRNLLGEAFHYFTDFQKEESLNIIRELRVPSEAFVIKRRNKSYYIKSWGLSKLGLLRCIPMAIICGNADLLKQYLELQRKFPDFDDISSNRAMAGIVQRPLQDTAYELMSKRQWLRSFIKYNKDRTQFQKEFLKGGLHEHSWAFQEAVKKDPSPEKISIIKESIGHHQIDSSYPILGLSGLCEAKGDPKKVEALFKKILADVNFESQLMACIRIAEFLIKNEQADRTIFNFLLDTSKKTPIDKHQQLRDPSAKTSINGLVTQGINSVHGSIAQALAFCSSTEMEVEVFDFIGHLFTSHSASTKAVLLFRYAYLMSLNKEKAFRLFIEYMTMEEDVFVLASSLEALNYLTNHNFEATIPILSKMVRSDRLGSEDTRLLFSILYRGTIHEKSGAEDLLYKLLKHSPDARNTSFNQIIKHYQEPFIPSELSNKVLLYALKNIQPNEFSQRRRFFFNKMEGIPLENIYPFLKEYVESPEFSPSDNFVSYLLHQCHHSPEKAISLFESLLKQTQKINTNNIMYGNHALVTRFIVGAFHALNTSSPAVKDLRKTLLVMLDMVLQDVRFWHKNLKLLEELT
ncbi:AAA family ATPase [Salinimicrobium sp. MT39]|uniref:AAA family ATPase n=1 Tax=Salinimicrobium profundisediminis TaxID=2994553 RepID=A0A9X3CWK5_9FLAO|nr:AAA family ATPase [Salinimicrobium profundisediminis]